MEIRRVRLDDMKAAAYNPRKQLAPGDDEYEKLKNSIDTFDCVEPIVWNEATGNIVGGHQRYTVLQNEGKDEAEVSVVHLSEESEKKLNIILNKTKGRWDIRKLGDILTELKDEGELELTGFEEYQLENILADYDHIDDLLEEDFGGYDEGKEQKTFTITFTLPGEAREAAERFLEETENAKAVLAEAVLRHIEGMDA